MGVLNLNKGLFKKVRIGIINVSTASIVVASSLGGALPLLLSGKAFAVTQTTAPTVTDPSAAKSVTTATYTIQGGVHDNSGTTVNIYKDVNNNGSIDVGDTVVATGSGSASKTYSISTPLSIGANNFLVTATKSSQTESVPVDVPTITRTVDTTAPTNPVASPVAGTYNSTQSVTLTSSDDSGSYTIYYTTNGTTPTNASTVYSSAVSVSSSETIKAIAYDPSNNTSSVVSFAYVIDTTAPTKPVASPVGGTYNSTQNVSLSSTDVGGSGVASIYYTNDGSPASKINGILYTGPISVSISEPINAVAYDNAGNVSTEMTENYVIDTTAPNAPGANPGAGTYGSSQNVQLTATDNSGGTGIQGIYYTTNGSSPTNSSTLYTGSISVSSDTTIKAISYDNAGNSSVVATFSYVIDTTAPTITVDSLTTSDNTPTVTGTVDDTTAVISITVDHHTYSATNNGDGTWSANVTHTLSDGTYDVAATATDTVGNVGHDSTTNELTVNTADNRTINSATVNGSSSYISNTPGETITASVNVTTVGVGANANFDSVAWLVDTTSGGTFTCVDTADHNNPGTYDQSFDITVPSTDGTYNAYFIAYKDDNCKNGASNTFELANAITLDTAAPIVAITSPTDGSTVNGTVSVSGTYSDANPAVLPEAFVITDSSNNLVDFSFSDFSWDTANGSFPDGTYTITLYGEDAAGNTASDAVTVTVDNTAPVVTVDNLSTTDTTPTITGTVDDTTATVTLSIDGGAPVSATNNGDGTWSYAVTSALAVGIHAVAVNAQDAVGNNATPANGTVTVNSLPSGGQGGGSGSNTPEVVTTSSNGGGAGSGDNGNVLGSQTNNTGKTSSTNTNTGNSNTNKSGHKSKNFLGLGWWWLLVLAALLGGIWWALGRRRNHDEE